MPAKRASIHTSVIANWQLGASLSDRGRVIVVVLVLALCYDISGRYLRVKVTKPLPRARSCSGMSDTDCLAGR